MSQTSPSQSPLPALLLIAGMALALFLRNSPFGDSFEHFWHLSLGFGTAKLSVHEWINDLFMVLFFFLVGIEIKREVVLGQLSSVRQAALPIIGAAGGMALPALIYICLNLGSTESLRGWAIPTATDIAFALGVLALVGRGLPPSLRIFLTALAIIDDLGAILIIAFFYTSSLRVEALLVAGAALGALFLIGKTKRLNLVWLVALGTIVWLAIFSSGIHATIAGVLTALMLPVSNDAKGFDHRIEHALQPWVNYGILPLFALANSGISFTGMSLGSIAAPVSLGCALGLFLGKQFGVFLACSFAVRSKLSALPEHSTWTQFFGVCVVTGIGFTMSLFITALAYGESALSVDARLGVLIGSGLSILVGAMVLMISSQNRVTKQSS